MSARAFGAGLLLGLALGGGAAWLALRQAPAGDAAEDGASASVEPVADDSPVVARVGPQVLTRLQFDERWQNLGPAGRAFHDQRGGRAHYLEELVEEMLLAEESRARGLDQGVAVREAVRTATNGILARPLLAQEVTRSVIPESAIRAAYEAEAAETTRPLRVQVAELVVTSGPTGSADDTTRDVESARRKAESLRERALAGEDFAELARESEAPTRAYGGLVGWVTEGRFAKAYEQAALALKPGEVSPVVETTDGFVVLKALGREEPSAPPFEEERGRIEAALAAEDPEALHRRYRELVTELRSRIPNEVHADRL